MRRQRACKTGVTYGKIRPGFFDKTHDLSDSAVRGLLRLVSWSAQWDYAGEFDKELILTLIHSSHRKAQRILTELLAKKWEWSVPALVRRGGSYWINDDLIAFGRDGDSWDAAEVHKVLERDGNACRYCAKVLQEGEITIDHVHPRSRGGGDKPRNLVVCCSRCNSVKGDKTLAECGMVLLPLPEKSEKMAVNQ